MNMYSTDNNKKNSEKFLIIYNEINQYMRKYLNEKEWTSHSELIRSMGKSSKIFKAYEHYFKSFADLRNSIVHNQFQRIANPIAEPHDYIVTKYEEIKNRVTNPPVAMNEIAISADRIFTTSLNSNALDVMKELIVYDCDYPIVSLDEESLLTQYEAEEQFSLKYLRFYDSRIQKAPNIQLTEEEKIKQL